MPTAHLIIGIVMAFLYGIVVGSFLNVCIYRLPVGKSLITPPSHCPRCNTRLRSRDLVPLFSFLFLGAKCRYCKTPISWRYFTIEFITGLLFTGCWLLLAFHYGADVWTTPVMLLLVLAWVFVSTMLVTFMIDLDTTYVIEPVTWLAMGAGLGYELIEKLVIRHQPIEFSIGHWHIPYLPSAIPGMLMGFLVFIAMDWFGRLIFRKPGMGLGDAFIGAAIGAMLGPKSALLSFGIAVFSCVLISVPLMIAGSLKKSPAPEEDEKKKPSTQDDEEEMPEGFYIPFGPFLTASAVLMLLFQAWIIPHSVNLWHWWLSLAG